MAFTLARMVGRPLPPQPVDFLLPTGIIVSLQCHQSETLSEVKKRLWAETKKNHPLFSLLRDAAWYNFLGVTTDGSKEEFVDDTRTLKDLDLFQPLLKLVERQGDQSEKFFNAEIGNLIGRRLHDFDVMGPEIQDFRRRILPICENAIAERKKNSRLMAKYYFPPNLDVTSSVPPNAPSNVFASQQFQAEVLFVDGDQGSSRELSTTINIGVNMDPSAIVKLVLQKQKFASPSSQNNSDYVLKVCGREEYFLEDCPITKYKYIRQCLVKAKKPQLALKMFKSIIPVEWLEERFIPPVYSGNAMPAMPQANRISGSTPFSLLTQSEFVSIYEIRETLKVKIFSAKNVNISDNYKVHVRAGIYHGGDLLCSIVSSQIGVSPTSSVWNEIMEFAMPMCDIPRSARLCFIIFGKNTAKKKKNQNVTIAMANVNLFNYSSTFLLGKHMLYCWPVDAGQFEDSLHYLGTTVPNPNTNECVQLEIEIMPPTTPLNKKPLTFPTFDQVDSYARDLGDIAYAAEKFPPSDVRELQRIIEQDPLATLDEQDQMHVWSMRNVCLKKFPVSLPKLLSSISWNNRSDVAQMYVLLFEWERLPPEKAMQLLDYHYADVAVRNYAVDCLEQLDDGSLSQYLLQLVQVLKYESYLDNALGHFLLKRALRNKTIGHYLFWHLRAEMHLPAVSVRFGLLLEAYCRGCGFYMKELSDQLNALNKMRSLTEMLQRTSKKRPEAIKAMQDSLREQSYVEGFSNFLSPLDPSLKLSQLKPDSCKFMDSKMKPLWLVFENEDKTGQDVYQIFKHGDDLRQDMLTLQIISLMDTFWQQAGLDLRMIPYGCLSTGDQIGMIEVVLNSHTVANIQKKKGGGAKGAFDKTTLYQYLTEHNPDIDNLGQAVENFTYSCCGYCVATFVLGIGDRHSDNIMLTKTGNLFHIDFGHFLGNFKSKFGVKRERVPFVLTNDFIYIITDGGDEHNLKFKKFKQLCEKAFLELRKKGDLFINLFCMMLSTGIPELRSIDDISYIREALCLGETEQFALKNFRKKFQEAVKNNNTVSINWWMHNMVH
ncbi:phosphatidylinositol 4,5-bisphosphate 3-kinase catalytic subunit beta isoform-like [Dysidea avara]|uniref:phosphatidylinositol 4,5-bisphosphate 3-kinase catalytic subunit beta isoform-like n=1 Tax=Dysidea avara TaxID=196820 RepID=UPI00332942D3